MGGTGGIQLGHVGSFMRHLRVLAAVAAFLAGGAAASAGDLSSKDGPEPAPVWSGLYVGGHLGGLWNSGRETSAESNWCRGVCIGWGATDEVAFEDDDDGASLVGGLHIGRNWQSGSSVFGIEADLDFADGFDYLATARARLGYARGSLLLYATAGVAFAGFDDSGFKFSTPQNAFNYDSDDERRVGLVVGGGVEYRLRSNWSLGVEGLYYRFADDRNEYASNFEMGCSGICYTHYRISEEDDNDFWSVRARLTYHFGEEYAEAPLK